MTKFSFLGAGLNMSCFRESKEDFLEKGKKAAIGEIREWNGQKFQKQANGGWIPVKGNASAKSENPSAEETTKAIKEAVRDFILGLTESMTDKEILNDEEFQNLVHESLPEGADIRDAWGEVTETVEHYSKMKYSDIKSEIEAEGASEQKSKPTDSQKEQKSNETKSYNEDWGLDFDNIRAEIGDNYTDVQIDTALEDLDDAGWKPSELVIPESARKSPGSASRKAWEIANKINSDLQHYTVNELDKDQETLDLAYGIVQALTFYDNKKSIAKKNNK